MQRVTDQNFFLAGQSSVNTSLVLLGARPLPPQEHNRHDDEPDEYQRGEHTTDDGSHFPTIPSHSLKSGGAKT